MTRQIQTLSFALATFKLMMKLWLHPWVQVVLNQTFLSYYLLYLIVFQIVVCISVISLIGCLRVHWWLACRPSLELWTGKHHHVLPVSKRLEGIALRVPQLVTELMMSNTQCAKTGMFGTYRVDCVPFIENQCGTRRVQATWKRLIFDGHFRLRVVRLIYENVVLSVTQILLLLQEILWKLMRIKSGVYTDPTVGLWSSLGYFISAKLWVLISLVPLSFHTLIMHGSQALSCVMICLILVGI